MSNITLSAGVRQNLLALQSTAHMMGATQNRLATGKAVNSALDNPLNFFTSQSLSNRAGDLNALLDSIGQAQQTLKAADNGITSLSKLVESAKSIAKQAQQAATPSTSYALSVTGSAIGADTAATGTSTVAFANDTAAIGTGTVAIAEDDAAVGIGSVAILDDQGAIKNGSVDDVASSTDLEADFGAGTLTITVNGVGHDFVINNSGDPDTYNTGAALMSAIGDIAGVSVSAGADGQLNIATDAGVTLGISSTGTLAADLGLGGALDQDAVNLVTQFGGLDGEDLTIDVGSASHTVTFGYGVGEVSTKQDLLDTLNAEFTGVATFSFDADDQLVITAADVEDAISVSGTNGSEALLGFDAGNTAFSATNDTLTALSGNLSVTVGEDAHTIDLTNVSNRADLLDALNTAFNGAATASFDADDQLVITAADADDAISIDAGANATALGFDADNDSFSGSNSVLAGLTGTLTVTVGGDETEVDLGGVNSAADLAAALGGAASINGDGNLVLTATGSDAISVSASDDAILTAIGLSAEYNPTNGDLAAMAGQSLTIQVGGGSTQTFEIDANTNRADLESWLGDLSLGTGVSIGLNNDGQVAVTSTSSQTITFGGTAAAGLGLEGDDDGVWTPTGSVTTPSTARANLQSQFNDLLSQIDTLANDASYNGINLLNGDELKVVFNEDGSSFLNIAGVDFTSSGLGLEAMTGDAFQSNASIDEVLTTIDNALSTLRSQAASFGSNLTTVQIRQDFTKNMINTLQIGADNLVLADTNEEGANLLALQTRQQLSSTALAMAAQADQAVLRLF